MSMQPLENISCPICGHSTLAVSSQCSVLKPHNAQPNPVDASNTMYHELKIDPFIYLDYLLFIRITKTFGSIATLLMDARILLRPHKRKMAR
jgi:hypothetical protein